MTERNDNRKKSINKKDIFTWVEGNIILTPDEQYIAQRRAKGNIFVLIRGLI